MLLADLDGTVLTSEGAVTEATADALRALRAAGWRVVLATGRGYRTTLPVARAVGLDEPVICHNGALVKDPRDHGTLATTTIRPDVARRAVQAVLDQGESACVHLDGWGRDHEFVLVAGRRIAPETRQFGALLDNRFLTRNLDESGDALEQCTEISVWTAEEALARCQRAVCAALDSQVRTLIIYAPNARSWVFEVFAPGADKWTAGHRLADRDGIPARDIVAVGDDVNDLEMIREAGLGIAMGNAGDRLRRIADEVTASCDEDGLAAAISRFL